VDFEQLLDFADFVNFAF